MDWIEAADALYADAGADFITQRKKLVRQLRDAGDRDGANQLSAARKPTAAAWLVNRTVREHRDVIDQLLQTGAELRDQTPGTNAAGMRELTARRTAAVDAACRAATQVADAHGRTLSSIVATQIRQTFDAAVLDTSAAAGLSAGRLVTGLQFIGFGLVDESGNPVELPESSLRAHAGHALHVVPGDRGDTAADNAGEGGEGGEDTDEVDHTDHTDDDAGDAVDDSEEAVRDRLAGDRPVRRDGSTGPAGSRAPRRLAAVDLEATERRRARARAKATAQAASIVVTEWSAQLEHTTQALDSIDLQLAALTRDREELAAEVEELTDQLEAAREQLSSAREQLAQLDAVDEQRAEGRRSHQRGTE